MDALQFSEGCIGMYAFVEHFVERSSLQQLHHDEEGATARPTEVVHGDDVGTGGQGTVQGSLAQEATRVHFVRFLTTQHLHGHSALQVQILSRIH